VLDGERSKAPPLFSGNKDVLIAETYQTVMLSFAHTSIINLMR